MKLTAQEVLSHRALDTKLNELENKARMDREELGRENGGLKREPKAAEERIARVERNVLASRTSQGTNGRAAKRRSSGGS